MMIVAAAIVDSLLRPQQLLLGRRSAPARLAGLWEFPGGKVEADEAEETAIHRELAEELGVQVQLGQEILPGAGEGAESLRNSFPGWTLAQGVWMRLWLAEITEGVPEPLEDHDLLAWMPLADEDAIMNLAWIPADIPVIRRLLDQLRQ